MTALWVTCALHALACAGAVVFASRARASSVGAALTGAALVAAHLAQRRGWEVDARRWVYTASRARGAWLDRGVDAALASAALAVAACAWAWADASPEGSARVTRWGAMGLALAALGCLGLAR